MVFRFTIDKVVNQYIPDSVIPSFPPVIARFLGSHKPKPRSDLLVWLDILIGSFCGIALLEAVFMPGHSPIFTAEHHAPMIIASYGATAILSFNSIGAPLAQPRNILMGHFTASLIGTCISKLFGLSEAGRNNYWASGALSVGISSVAMSILNCVHPPAGASALLPSIDVGIREMSWWYLPVHLISSCLVICVALIVNNVLRAYPAYWWTPMKKEMGSNAVVEKDLSWKEMVAYDEISRGVEITGESILVPAKLGLTEEELAFLNGIRQKIESYNGPSTEGKSV
ncbi:hypothetical protein BABINDRAFT_159735 [Babjeviella inositovora NRRL Y-12698]|uniref:HPP transmembrane region domain-containing protein n=1 Tax=Babjeviella inositovora NRRL Y-12698 TaxID=984486 RepID=A0A1E3QUS2_9ASCO|nr:uncharacterized protein BABINDRAFT_159735 [Babjeviella inositovora NRRL Y-12698]ODQ81443.1 hypothetical protein BABINDRAFT_159735 [Babjeviella inositovora NRRL Y-12698]